MSVLIIGSLAFNLNTNSCMYNTPLPGDIDIIGTYDDCVAFANEQMESIDSTEHFPEEDRLVFKGKTKTNTRWGIIDATLISDDKPCTNKTILDGKIGCIYSEEYKAFYLDLDMLYLLKMSHRFKKFSVRPHLFSKTMKDIHTLRALGCSISDERKPLLKAREKESYNYNHPSLNQGKKTFFSNDGIKYEWDHDTIHEAVATMERPAYTYYIEPGQEVKCSKQMFFDAPEEVRLLGVLEEALVLALERAQITSQIPNPPPPVHSFMFALAKVCTSITSGWFRDYAWENYWKVVKIFFESHTNYVDKAKNAIKEGRIKPFTGSKY